MSHTCRILKRVGAALLALTFMTGGAIMPASAKEEQNMLANGDFSSGFSEWKTWSNNTSSAAFSIEPTGGPDGSPCMKLTNNAPAASSLFQFAACGRGKTYMLTCDIKYENVGTEGHGVCLGTTSYSGPSGTGENIGEKLSSAAVGTSDWRTMNFIFTVPTGAASVNCGPRLWGSTGTIYVDNLVLIEVTDEAATSGTYDLSLSSTANRHKVDALGCEWDPKLLLEVNRKNGVTEDDLTFIKGQMETMGLQAVRMMVQPDWFEKTNDNDDPFVANPDGFTFDNDEMRSLFAYLKVCDELGIRVTLTWWGAPDGHWLACENIGDWIGAPNDLDEMTENIVYLLTYIRDDLGYTCVKELILQNEPSYSFKVDGGNVDFVRYVDYYHRVYERLVAEEMDDIVLVGADDSQDFSWFYRSYDALKDICGKFDSHNYDWSYDTYGLDLLAEEFVSSRTAVAGDIPFYLGEFGDGSTVGAYVATSTDTYERGIYVASVVVNAFKAGAAGASYWPLHDVYYYENIEGGDNGGLMSQGLISFKKDGAWGFRPIYYAYGLLCNYIPYGSEIYNVTGNTDHLVDTVAAKTADGRWSIIAVNRSDAAQTVKVGVAEDQVYTNMKQYVYANNALPTDGQIIASTATVTPAEGQYSVEIPACSFVVLSNLGMTEDEMTAGVGEYPDEIPGTPGNDSATTPTDPAETGNATETGDPSDTGADGGDQTPADPADTTPGTQPTESEQGDTLAGDDTTDAKDDGDGGCQSTVGLAGLTASLLPIAWVARKRKWKDA